MPGRVLVSCFRMSPSRSWTPSTRFSHTCIVVEFNDKPVVNKQISNMPKNSQDRIDRSPIDQVRKTSVMKKEFYLYYFTSKKHLRSILTLDGMKVSVMKTGNDPFECDFVSDRNWAECEPYTFLQNKEHKQYLFEKLTKETMRRVFCLSANVSSPLMWGHYAEGHKGVCLVFKFDLARDTSILYRLRTIIYRNRRIGLSDCIYQEGNNYYLLPELARFYANYTKISDWSYEREFKIDLDLIIHGEANPHFTEKKTKEGVKQFSRFLMPYLDGIIIGSNSDLEISRVESLIEECKKRNNIEREIICVKAHPHQSENTIVAGPYGDMDECLYWKLRSETLKSQCQNREFKLVSMSEEKVIFRSLPHVHIGGLIEEGLEAEVSLHYLKDKICMRLQGQEKGLPDELDKLIDKLIENKRSNIQDIHTWNKAYISCYIDIMRLIK